MWGLIPLGSKPELKALNPLNHQGVPTTAQSDYPNFTLRNGDPEILTRVLSSLNHYVARAELGFGKSESTGARLSYTASLRTSSAEEGKFLAQKKKKGNCIH